MNDSDRTFGTIIHSPGRICYACSVDVSRDRISYELYETVVEYIEALDSETEFNRVTLWKALGKGFKLYVITYMVIRDMHAHGLIECTNFKHNRCYSYRLKKSLSPIR